ncbi:hypothetical protein MPTK1_5g21620 [Marchantia polymorpha subsp. ruderalis]|uniref:FH2 domain-containing protein n=1 Tax=Marchantia polymorpha subsp. ruderalis TaxID=1480154 RepID=A0AAF6BKU1_MARPO|nr:hypothetical protein Mp_5g21620 [Marchantia polymorpha subsp. ruderalis]
MIRYDMILLLVQKSTASEAERASSCSCSHTVLVCVDNPMKLTASDVVTAFANADVSSLDEAELRNCLQLVSRTNPFGAVEVSVKQILPDARWYQLPDVDRVLEVARFKLHFSVTISQLSKNIYLIDRVSEEARSSAKLRHVLEAIPIRDPPPVTDSRTDRPMKFPERPGVEASPDGSQLKRLSSPRPPRIPIQPASLKVYDQNPLQAHDKEVAGMRTIRSPRPARGGANPPRPNDGDHEPAAFAPTEAKALLEVTLTSSSPPRPPPLQPIKRSESMQWLPACPPRVLPSPPISYPPTNPPSPAKGRPGDRIERGYVRLQSACDRSGLTMKALCRSLLKESADLMEYSIDREIPSLTEEVDFEVKSWSQSSRELQDLHSGWISAHVAWKSFEGGCFGDWGPPMEKFFEQAQQELQRLWTFLLEKSSCMEELLILLDADHEQSTSFDDGEPIVSTFLKFVENYKICADEIQKEREMAWKLPEVHVLDDIFVWGASDLDMDHLRNLMSFCPNKEQRDMFSLLVSEEGSADAARQKLLELMSVPGIHTKLLLERLNDHIALTNDDSSAI